MPRKAASPPPEPKTCAACGRTIEWRKKWERDWDSVRYCSNTCRRRKVKPIDEQLEAAILELIAARGPGKTICPSEAARAVDADGWREHMEPARAAARRLVAQDKAQIFQKGKLADPSTARGPIRVGLPD
ncbi:MAG: DUF2256 and DUF3253 domain-containing protein [Planctomycetota bacterium]